MRFGYTTGSCAAAAAAKGAVEMLLENRQAGKVQLITPKGILLELDILHTERGAGWASCAVKKDGGDDPDATNGLEIYVKAEKKDFPGIVLEGGEGVGRVTKKGLEQPVGSPAINKVPRKMILKEAEEICSRTGYKGGLLLTVSVPGGAEVGARTFNPRLGIQGGISILGTSGIVEPMSEAALIKSIEIEMRPKSGEWSRISPDYPGKLWSSLFKRTYGSCLLRKV